MNQVANQRNRRQVKTSQAVAAPDHIKDLVPDPANRRSHNPRNIGMVVDALHEVGAARSIVIDENNVILAGNGVTEAAAEAGITKLRVIDAAGDELIAVRRSGLTDAQKRHLAIADNRTAELATWNSAQFRDDLAGGRDFAAFFTKDELAAILNQDGAAKAGLTDPDEVPAERPTGIVAGDLFELGPHRLLCGDCTVQADVARLMGNTARSETVLLTDPPYCSGGFQEAGRKAGSVGTRGTELIANDQLSTRGYIALIRTALMNVGAGVSCVFTDWRMWVNLFDVVESSGYGVRAMVVWDKQTPGMGRGWRNQHELIMVASRVSMAFDPHKAQGNVIQCTRTGNVLHATEKPVELLSAVLDVSDVCPVVVDVFAGSGSTLIAAEQLSRPAHLMELTPSYCQVIIDRWEAFTGQTAQKVGEAVRA